ncbi:adenosine kinase [Bacteroidia bacterium]|nr:adenosine kinase [Bacteroidia bacterium]
MKPSIVGIGNALTDIIIRIDSDRVLADLNLPKGSMQLVDKQRACQILDVLQQSDKSFVAGGSAANTIHGVAHLGAKTGFIGSIGCDLYGEKYTQSLQDSGIQPFLTQQSDMQSGTAITLLSPDSERTFATYLGAALELKDKDLTINDLQGYECLHVEGYLVQNYALVKTVMQNAKQAGLKISLDMASYNVVEDHRPFLEEMLRNYVDIVFANEEEAHAFTGQSPQESLTVLASLCDYAIVKLGAKGSLIQHGDTVQPIQAKVVPCVDTNGAGDSYAAGFLYGLLSGMTLKQSGDLGTAIASEVIGVLGAKLNDSQWDSILREFVTR